MVKHSLPLALTLMLATALPAQTRHVYTSTADSTRLKNHTQDTLRKIRLHISKDILATDIPPSDYYITLNYDFGDSISIFVNRKEVFKRKLDYVPMDSNQTFYPYNRILIKIAGGTKDQKNIPGSTCKVIFWQSGEYIAFHLKKSIHYYDVGAAKDKDAWSLTFLNVLPWP